MTTLDQTKQENSRLRLQLEAAKPGISATVPASHATATLDEIFAEGAALKALAEAFIASHKLQQRGAAVAAKYQGKVTSHTEAKAALYGGTRTAKQISVQHEISRLEALLADYKAGSPTWKAISGRVEHARTKLAEQ